MKKLIFAVTAIVTLSVLAPSSGISEPTHPNEIGLNLTPDGLGETGTDLVGSPVTVYLVLTKPHAGNDPCSGLQGFDCQLNFDPIGGIFRLGDSLNGDGFNIGDADHIGEGFLEYIVGMADVVPTIDEAVLMVTFSFFNTNMVSVENESFGAVKALYR